jgi:hypothetical protein
MPSQGADPVGPLGSLWRPPGPSVQADSAYRPPTIDLAPASRERSITLYEVEAPRLTPVGKPERKHHAIGFATDAPKAMLRSIGIDATECSTRVRLPTRFKPAREGGSADVTLQLGLGCKF